MRRLLNQADELLRIREVGRGWSVGRLLGLLAVYGIFYGMVMGSYGAFLGQVRLTQMLYSGVKVPMLLLVSFALSLPSFFVINTLLGLRDDFREAVQALLVTQAVLTVVLAALGPLTVFWYVSFELYPAAILFNGVMFAGASFTAQGVLRRLYRPLIARHRRHRGMLRLWLVIYVFVAVQMAWVLRPFIGHPDAPTRFFRQEAWGNAYVEVGRIILRVLGG